MSLYTDGSIAHYQNHIAAEFDTYRFADYKEHVIELLDRVCTVSVEAMKIIKQMPE